MEKKKGLQKESEEGRPMIDPTRLVFRIRRRIKKGGSFFRLEV